MVVKARSFAFFVRCVTAVVNLYYGRGTHRSTAVVRRVRRLPYNEQYGKNGGAEKRYDFSDIFK